MCAKKNEWPKVVKSGNTAVRVYRVAHKTTGNGFIFTIAWIGEDGKRHTMQRADEGKALDEAEVKAKSLAAGQVEAAGMSNADRVELLAARKLCHPISLLSALNEWKQIYDLTAGQGTAAAQAWAAKAGKIEKRATVSTVMDAFLKAKEGAGVDIDASYSRMFPSLRENFGAREIASVTSADLQAWFAKRYTHPVSRNTARTRAVTLWRWARKHEYLPRDVQTEAERTEAARVQETEIGIINVDTERRLLAHFQKKHPEYIAPLAVAVFCGLRRAEIHGQVWEDIDLDRKLLRVTRAKRNTPARRLVPLCDAAVAWLSLVEKKERVGGVCTNWAIDRVRDIGRHAGFELPENCFRHGYISHRVAATGNVAETSLDAGNSPKIIFRHYRELVSKAEGEAWFAVMPK